MSSKASRNSQTPDPRIVLILLVGLSLATVAATLLWSQQRGGHTRSGMKPNPPPTTKIVEPRPHPTATRNPHHIDGMALAVRDDQPQPLLVGQIDKARLTYARPTGSRGEGGNPQLSPTKLAPADNGRYLPPITGNQTSDQRFANSPASLPPWSPPQDATANKPGRAPAVVHDSRAPTRLPGPAATTTPTNKPNRPAGILDAEPRFASAPTNDTEREPKPAEPGAVDRQPPSPAAQPQLAARNSGANSPPKNNDRVPVAKPSGATGNPDARGREGTQSGPLTTVPAGDSLDGTDPIIGDLVVDAGGTYSPGHSPGAQQISGDFTLNGNLIIEIRGNIAEQDYDVIKVGGAADLTNGNILFAFLDDFTPAPEDLFDFLLADEILSAGVNYYFGNFGDPLHAPIPNSTDTASLTQLGYQLWDNSLFGVSQHDINVTEILAAATASQSVTYATGLRLQRTRSQTDRIAEPRAWILLTAGLLGLLVARCRSGSGSCG